ncbi:MAG: hypothetical protein V7609_2113 [Verrucomicrobiota bacterium]
MQRRTTELRAELLKELAEAKRLHDEAIAARKLIEKADRTELERAWLCGKKLNHLKEQLPHGQWEPWIKSHWPTLKKRTRTLYMKIDRDNPNVQRVAHLKFDSIRKYAIDKVPKKKHSKEAGDQSFSKPEHHSTVVNEFARLFQRIDAGQQKVDEDELRKDFRSTYERLQRLYAAA